MNKVFLIFVAVLAVFSGCNKTASKEAEKQKESSNQETPIVLKVSSYPAFCTSSCSDFVGFIPESGGSSGATSWGNFHLWISQTLPYDVVITVENRYNGTAYFTQWGQQFVIPAGQNNSASISGEQEANMICAGGFLNDYWDGTYSGQVSRTYSVNIVSIDRVDNNANLNSQYQLYPGSGNLSVSSYCYKNE